MLNKILSPIFNTQLKQCFRLVSQRLFSSNKIIDESQKIDEFFESQKKDEFFETEKKEGMFF